jgi:hypothetical protein
VKKHDESVNKVEEKPLPKEVRKVEEKPIINDAAKPHEDLTKAKQEQLPPTLVKPTQH